MDKDRKNVFSMPSPKRAHQKTLDAVPLPKPTAKSQDEPKPADASSVLAIAQDVIIQRFPDIINGLIGAAIKGGHLPARLLMDLAGIAASPPDDPTDEREESLAQMMFNELEKAKAG